MMERSKFVFGKVEKLYLESNTSMGKWMWLNHTQWVADVAQKLAKKYNANIQYVFCAALLHDLGDSKYEREHKDFETWSWLEAKSILKEAGFRHVERKAILEAVRTHSCHEGHLPTTLEGKVLATADAMWHIKTNFFPVICYMNRPDYTSSYKEWQEWFLQKIERDFGTKIFFEDERTEVRDDYDALMKVFGNTALNDITT